MKRISFVLITAALCLSAIAQQTWTGGGVDASWGTPGNWANGTVPANPYTGKIYFGQAGMGTNKLDVNRQVRDLIYTNTSLTAMHTLDLDGHTLTVDGNLQVWVYDGTRPLTNSNTRLAITNGVLQLGTVARAANVLVAHHTTSPANNYIVTNNVALINADMVITNLGNLYVGYHTADNAGGTILEGGLDLSRSTIISQGISNRLTCANFAVGGAKLNTSGRGWLSLPPAITAIETGDFIVGGDGSGFGWGILDLGNDSQLKSITAKTAFWYGNSGDGVISNWPGSVDLILGTLVKPASFRIGSGQRAKGVEYVGVGAGLVNSNAVVKGYISDFLVGTSLRYNYGISSTGYVDLATCAIHTGGESNALHTTELRVGGMKIGMANNSYGGKPAVLLLPPSLKKVVTGFFQLGAISAGEGILDFGADSQLESLIVTNDFYFGYNGAKASLVNFPTNGVTVLIGTPARPAIYSQGSASGRIYANPSDADLVLTNVIWSACLQNVEIGVSRYDSNPYDYWVRAKLDLRESVLQAFEVAGSLEIGHHFSPHTNYKRTIGEVYLPEGHVTIATNLLMGDMKAPSLGLLDLSGTTVTVGGRAELWSTAIINTRVRGESAGLELLSSAADALSVSNGAVINVIFEQDPADLKNPRYSGLVAAGDRVAQWQDLHDDGQLVWDTAALTPRWARKVAITYDPKNDITYVGFDPRIIAAMINIR